MSKADAEETGPVFLAYGQAVYAAQLLEHGLRALLNVIDLDRKHSGLEELELELDDPGIQKSLNTLFGDLLRIEYITEAEKKTIRRAIKDRNVLVHSYWGEKNILATLFTDGRAWLIDDLGQRRERCGKANDIVSSIIERYLARYGTSVEALAAPLLEQWRNDAEPPDEVLK